MAPKISEMQIKKRKDEILEAAKKVFIRKGFSATTMKDIVEESNLSRGGVYQYFSSPEEMLEALHSRTVEALPEQLDDLFKKHRGYWKAIEAMIDGYDLTEEPGFGMVEYEYSVLGWRNERYRNFMVTESFKAVDTLSDFFKKGTEAGEFDPLLSCESIALFFFNVEDGLLLHGSIAGVEEAKISEQIEGLKLYLKTVLQVKDPD